jgi:hypothetical protein
MTLPIWLFATTLAAQAFGAFALAWLLLDGRR